MNENYMIFIVYVYVIVIVIDDNINNIKNYLNTNYLIIIRNNTHFNYISIEMEI